MNARRKGEQRAKEISHALFSVTSRTDTLLLETDPVSYGNNLVFTSKLCPQTSLVPYSTENCSMYFAVYTGLFFSWLGFLCSFRLNIFNNPCQLLSEKLGAALIVKGEGGAENNS